MLDEISGTRRPLAAAAGWLGVASHKEKERSGEVHLRIVVACSGRGLVDTPKADVSRSCS